MRSETLVEVIRGQAVEFRHRGSFVVVDSQGETIYSHGDRLRSVFVRATIQPFVAALSIITGAADAFGVEPDELAVAAGVRSKTAEDAEFVQRLLAKIGVSQLNLGESAAEPSDQIATTMLDGLSDSPIRLSECAGEHASWIAIGVHDGYNADGYWDSGHPVHRLISDFAARLIDGIGISTPAIDDCALPTWPAPLSSLARAYSWLARPDQLPVTLHDLHEPLLRVRDAMLARAPSVGTHASLDMDLLRTGDAFIAKGGEGLLAIGCIGSGLGLAVAIDDGDSTGRATAVVALESLKRLQLIDEGDAERLSRRHWPQFSDTLGRPVATVRPAFHLPVSE